MKQDRPANLATTTTYPTAPTLLRASQEEKEGLSRRPEREVSRTVKPAGRKVVVEMVLRESRRVREAVVVCVFLLFPGGTGTS